MKLTTILLLALSIGSIATSQQIIMSNHNDREEAIQSLEGKSADEIMIDVGNGKKVPLSKVNKPHYALRGPEKAEVIHKLRGIPVEPEVRKQEEQWEAQHGLLNKNPILDPGTHKPVVDAESFPGVEPQVRAQEEQLEKQRAQKNAILDPAIHRAVPDASSFPEVEEQKKND